MTEPVFESPLKLEKTKTKSVSSEKTSKKKEGSSLFSSMLKSVKKEASKKDALEVKGGVKDKNINSADLKKQKLSQKESLLELSKKNNTDNKKEDKYALNGKDSKALDSKKANKHAEQEFKGLKDEAKPDLKNIKDLSLKDLQDIKVKNLSDKSKKIINPSDLKLKNIKDIQKKGLTSETKPDLKNIKDLSIKDLQNIKDIQVKNLKQNDSILKGNEQKKNFKNSLDTNEANTSKNTKSLLDKMLNDSKEKIKNKSEMLDKSKAKLSKEIESTKTISKPKLKEDLSVLAREKANNLLKEVKNPKEELELEKAKIEKQLKTNEKGKKQDFAKLEKEEKIISFELNDVASAKSHEKLEEKKLKNHLNLKTQTHVKTKAKGALLVNEYQNTHDNELKGDAIEKTDSSEKNLLKNIKNEKKITQEDKKEKKENLNKENKTAQENIAFASVIPANIDKKDIQNKDLKNNKNTFASKLSDSSKNIYKKTKDLKDTEVLKKENLNPLSASMYMQSQAQRIKEEKLIKKEKGLNLVKHAQSKKDIKEGAKILDFNPRDLSMTKEEAKNLEKKSSFEKTNINALSNATKLHLSTKEKLLHHANQVASDFDENGDKALTSVSHKHTATNEAILGLNVSPSENQIIKSKIIGARQGLNSMLNSLAKNMYENYKPPVSAFRINLNPSNLGNIAIIIKAKDLGSKSLNKTKDMSISLSLSSSATMNSLMANQEDLKSALRQNFSNNDNFTLNFSMQEGNKGQEQRQNFSSSTRDEGQKEDSQSNQDSNVIPQNGLETNVLNNYM